MRTYYLYLYICIYAFQMPMALGMNHSDDRRAGPPGFVTGIPMYNLQESSAGVENDGASCSSSSSSTIGKNSDECLAGGDADGDGAEFQSSSKSGGLENLEALEEALPTKKGISNFYVGKSKSFINLSDAYSYSSLNDIVKLENAYTRQRKNLFALNNYLGTNSSSQDSCGGVNKKPTTSRRSLDGTMSCCMGNNTQSMSFSSRNGSSSSPPEQSFSAGHSLSLSDLQGAAAQIPRNPSNPP